MQLQEILTYVIVAFASGVVLYSLYKAVFPGKQGNQQGGCSSNCNCDAVKMRKELLKNTNKLPKKSTG